MEGESVHKKRGLKLNTLLGDFHFGPNEMRQFQGFYQVLDPEQRDRSYLAHGEEKRQPLGGILQVTNSCMYFAFLSQILAMVPFRHGICSIITSIFPLEEFYTPVARFLGTRLKNVLYVAGDERVSIIQLQHADYYL
jgi:hypothetical protein